MRTALAYIAVVLLANLTATLFVPLPVFGAVAVGTFIFGITFTLRDRLHRRGRRFVYATIVTAAGANLAMLLGFRFVFGEALVEAIAAGGFEWLAGGMEMLTGNGLRVFTASFIAIVLAEAADTEIYQLFRHKSWIGRVLRSNLVSIPLDSVLFNLIAFAGSAHFPVPVLVAIIWGEIVVKFATGGLFALWRPKEERRPLAPPVQG